MAIPQIGKVHFSGVSERTKTTVPFFNSLYLNNNNLYEKVLDMKLVLLQKIYNLLLYTIEFYL